MLYWWRSERPRDREGSREVLVSAPRSPGSRLSGFGDQHVSLGEEPLQRAPLEAANAPSPQVGDGFFPADLPILQRLRFRSRRSIGQGMMGLDLGPHVDPVPRCNRSPDLGIGWPRP